MALVKGLDGHKSVDDGIKLVEHEKEGEEPLGQFSVGPHVQQPTFCGFRGF